MGGVNRNSRYLEEAAWANAGLYINPFEREQYSGMLAIDEALKLSGFNDIEMDLNAQKGLTVKFKRNNLVGEFFLRLYELAEPESAEMILFLALNDFLDAESQPVSGKQIGPSRSR